MLIQSDRHTAEDLRLWAEYERADRLHSSRDTLARKVVQADREIRRFVNSGRCYVSVSWGKDSVAVADLVMQVDQSIPLCWVRWNDDNPDSELVRDAFVAKWPAATLHEIAGPANDHDDGRRGFAILEKRHGPRRIMGIRADESSSRRLSAATHGAATDNVCRPLLRWSSIDVFAYLHARDLPVHPVYAMLGGGRWPRERLRVDSLGGKRGTGIGRAEWEREYYGDVLRRLEAAR